MGGTAREARGGAGSSLAGHSRAGMQTAPSQARAHECSSEARGGTAGGGPRRSWELTGPAQPQG
eukprot:2721859-Alexandrium_andersonii.AAC.1